MFVTALTEWTSLLKKRNFFGETQKEEEKMIQLSSAAASETFFNHRDQVKNTFFVANNDETKTKWNKIWMKMLWTKKVFYLAFRSYSEATKEEMEVWEKNLWKIM